MYTVFYNYTITFIDAHCFVCGHVYLNYCQGLLAFSRKNLIFLVRWDCYQQIILVFVYLLVSLFHLHI